MKRIGILLAILITPIICIGDQPPEFAGRLQKTNQSSRLTTNDVPAKWRTTMEDVSTNSSNKNASDCLKKIFFRGKKKVLEIDWSKDWANDMFIARVYDGETMITRIVGFRSSMFVNPPEDCRQYEVTTEIESNGKFFAWITGKNGYDEFIEICGRGTHPMNDLDYTKTMLSMKQTEPVIDAFVKDIGKNKNDTEPK